MESFNFREYKEEDFIEQRSLFKSAFPETVDSPLSEKNHYEWKFKNLPSSPSSYQYVAIFGQRLVGYYAALPFTYVINGQRKTCGMVCDVMTHPEMQGKGVFNKLGQYSINQMKNVGLDFISGYPIRPHVIKGHIKAGWSVAMREAMYIRPLNTATVLKDKVPAIIVKVLNFILSIYNQIFNFKLFNKEYSTQVLTRDEFLNSKEYESFFSEWAKSQSIYLEKTQKFMQWRLSAPSSEYSIVVLREKEKWIGLCVTRMIVLKNAPTLAILDMMVLDSKKSKVSMLHLEIFQLARKNAADFVALMISEHWASGYKLRLNGFIKTPYVFSVIFKSFKEELNTVLFKKEKNWHLMWIDSDDF